MKEINIQINALKEINELKTMAAPQKSYARIVCREQKQKKG